MILAAGRGERLRPMTDTTPKPLLRVRGQPLIERHVMGLVRAGVQRIVINLAWLGSQISEYLGDGTLRLASDRDAHLVLVPNPRQHPRGDFGLERGLALSAAATQYTFSGIAMYRDAFFAGCTDGAFPLKPLLVRSMAAKRCSAELYTGVWEDVGSPERLQALNA